MPNIPTLGHQLQLQGWATQNLSQPIFLPQLPRLLLELDLLGSHHRQNCALKQGGEGWWSREWWRAREIQLPPKKSTNKLCWPVTACLPWGYWGCCGRTQAVFGAKYVPVLLGQRYRVLGSFDSVLQGHPWSEKTWWYLQVRLCLPAGRTAPRSILLLRLFEPLPSVSLTVCQVFTDYLQCHFLFLSCSL